MLSLSNQPVLYSKLFIVRSMQIADFMVILKYFCINKVDQVDAFDENSFRNSNHAVFLAPISEIPFRSSHVNSKKVKSFLYSDLLRMIIGVQEPPPLLILSLSFDLPPTTRPEFRESGSVRN